MIIGIVECLEVLTLQETMKEEDLVKEILEKEDLIMERDPMKEETRLCVIIVITLGI